MDEEQFHSRRNGKMTGSSLKSSSCPNRSRSLVVMAKIGLRRVKEREQAAEMDAFALSKDQKTRTRTRTIGGLNTREGERIFENTIMHSIFHNIFISACLMATNRHGLPCP